MRLTEKEAAALERLEAEKKRRIEDKIQSGAAVRVPLQIVVGARESVDVVKARKLKLEQLRRNGETREVFFDETALITGVPRPGREPENYRRPVSSEPPAPSICDRRSAGGAPAPFAVSEPQPTARSEAVPNMSTSFRRIWTQTEQPSDSNPGGAIVEGQFRIMNGSLEVTDLQGRLLATQPINSGDDAEAAARTVLRKKRSSAFYDRIVYPRRSMP
jgi:hypothetical protein